MPDHIYALPEGYRFEAYELQRLLSVDRYGLKYFGYDHGEGRRVAIKEYLPESLAVRQQDGAVVPRSSAVKADFDAGLTRFLDGAQAQSRVNHPGMAKVHSWLQANGTGYIVMEYVVGATLSAKLRKRGSTLPRAELEQLVQAVLGALEQLHDIEVLHQDITPGNIVFRADGSPLLLESGVGRYTRGAARQAFADRSGGFESVPPDHSYAALEQYTSRRRLGPWTDIYAFAAVLYRCVTGQIPPTAPDRIIDDDLVPAAKAAQGAYDPKLLAAIDAGLAVPAGQRPTSIAAWRAKLPGAAEDLSAAGGRPGHLARGSTRVAARGFARPIRKEGEAVAAIEGAAGPRRRAIAWLIPTAAALAITAMLTWVDVGVLRSSGEDAGPPPPATLLVRTVPEGVEVRLGNRTLGQTPLEIADLAPGTYNLTLRHPLYETVELAEQNFLSGVPTLVERTLVRATGGLRILTSPPGAWIELAGERFPEVTPTSLEGLPAGPIELLLGAEGYRQAMVQADVPRGSAGTLDFTLEPSISYGTLTLALTPENATVTLPDVELAYSPGMRLPEGAHRIEVSAAEYLPDARTVEVVGDVRLPVELIALMQPFTIAVTPVAALVRFTDGGGYSPGMLLPPGEYEVEAMLVEYETRRTTLSHGGGPTEYALALAPGIGEFADLLASGGVGPAMVLIPSGEFRMGCAAAADCRDNEGPEHSVVLPAPFALSKHEVTFAEYGRFAEATGRAPPRRPRGWVGGDLPVVNVSWDDAAAYAEWLSTETGRLYRLPSEAEWEYAARAGTQTSYSWGDAVGAERANCSGCGSQWDNQRPAPVASFEANPWGLHDLHGNVEEWVLDCHNDDHLGAPSDGSARMDGDCTHRILRGGAWSSSPTTIRVAAREWDNAAMRNSIIGFRLAAASQPR